MSPAAAPEAWVRLVPGARRDTVPERMAGGGNNQVYRVATPEGTFVLKRYFRHPQDPRDRLAGEFGFLTFAWEAGLRCVPRPVAHDPEAGVGVYAFVEGQPLTAEAIGPAEVEAALAFLLALNRHRDHPLARALPPASEACFSLREHLALLDRRLARLEGLGGETPAARSAKAFVDGELRPAWDAQRARLLAQPDLDAGVGAEDRLISPSDFGFHNALRTQGGALAFLDFEYGGWDDPAKTVGDFFSQVELPAPPDAFDAFAAAVAATLPDPGTAMARMRLLRPLVQLKWCCIVLNPFLPVDRHRRAFARPDAAGEAAQLAQVEKARRLLAPLRESVR